MRRVEQLNDEFRKEIANLIAREMPLKNCLVTVSYVKCSLDLSDATIAVSVWPYSYAQSSLKKLSAHSHIFTQMLKKKMRLKRIPKFFWYLDETEERAAGIEKILDEINRK